MENKQNFTTIRYIVTIPVLLALILIMMPVMMTFAEDSDQSSTGEGGIYNVFPNAQIMKQTAPPEPANISGLSYDIPTRTVTLSGADIKGTLQFNSFQNQEADNMVEANYTVELASGTTSYIYALKLMDEVSVTIKGEGTLIIQAPNKNTDYGAALTFNDTYKYAAPKLIIEGGTVLVDSTHHGFTLKEAGCLYVKEGTKSFKVIGRTSPEGEDLPIMPTRDELLENEGLPKIFSDLPCLATYVSSINNGGTAIYSPNGTGNKTFSDTSFFGEDHYLYHVLEFKPGHTVTWQNDDGSVLETDKGYYWDGQTPEYNGDTPTKAADAQYTYTFAGWSEPIEALYEDKTYIATYSTTLNKYTITYDANGHGTAPKSKTVDYGTVISKPSDPTADGWDFGGWYTDKDCTNAYDFNSQVTGNLTLYAKWTENKVAYNDVKTVAGKIQDITSSNIIKPEANPFGAKIQNNSELKSLLSLTDDEIAKGVNVWLEVKDASANVSDADKSKVLEAANGYTIGMYLDINLFKKVGSGDASKVSATNGKVKVSFVVPENMRKSGRTYEIIRVHNGVATVITASYNETTHVLTFETDGFSTYALAYTDDDAKKSPRTIDTDKTDKTMMWYTLFLVSCAGLYVLGVSRKRK